MKVPAAVIGRGLIAEPLEAKRDRALGRNRPDWIRRTWPTLPLSNVPRARAGRPSPAVAAARPFEPAPLLIAFAVLAPTAFSTAALNDGDTGTHVATGLWSLARGAPRLRAGGHNPQML